MLYAASGLWFGFFGFGVGGSMVCLCICSKSICLSVSMRLCLFPHGGVYVVYSIILAPNTPLPIPIPFLFFLLLLRLRHPLPPSPFLARYLDVGATSRTWTYTWTYTSPKQPPATSQQPTANSQQPTATSNQQPTERSRQERPPACHAIPIKQTRQPNSTSPASHPFGSPRLVLAQMDQLARACVRASCATTRQDGTTAQRQRDAGI
ncbi:uncharacterized protein K452DRAFT_115052 [Aplosporella prunicola CBS 121167]|uniref:Uncharacterized protein n=1 Tax=Aplosporella prunicola CBS 121167 TaxID=1176127 RepID=A0A6A6B1X6_9PEZI|nr:uncharacterized protein K452DRAFT_115052 [Aplosporella prunicola CBS 121167]KAF2137017.1 hypothetical protein K452DRAFT_115052 [Aplosporella prunicola CBS 121167]